MTDDQHHSPEASSAQLDAGGLSRPTNRRATWGAVLAVLVWPVGLVLSFLGYRRAGAAGYGRRRSLAGMIAAGLIAAFSLGRAAAEPDSPASATRTAATSESAAETASASPAPAVP